VVHLCDLDRDGDVDLLKGNYNVSLFQGLPDEFRANFGAGAFPGITQGFGNARTLDLATADLDVDGKPEIVAGHDAHMNAIWSVDGSGAFINAITWNTSTASTTAVAIGDVDRDGDLDLITANNKGESNGVWLNR